MSPPLLSPTTMLLLLLLLLGTAPHTVATQPQGDLEADIRLMLEMVRRHLVTAGTVLEDVKHLTMSMEQMTQRMDALETTVAQKMDSPEANVGQRMDTLETNMGQRMDALETSVTQRMDRCEDRSADQTEKIEDEITKQMRKLEDKIENQTEKIYRLLEPLVTDVNELSKRSQAVDCSDIATEWNSGSGTYDIFPALEPMPLPTDCSDIATKRKSGSGTYDIFPSGEDSEAVKVYCDIEGSEGWTVLQRRVNGPQDFDKGWAEYKKGFGDLEGEHWVGNENMHILTSRRKYRIQIVLEGCNKIGDVLVANYGVFNIGSESRDYQLTVGGFSGNATDGMNGCDSDHNHNGQKFTTKDRDNDLWSGGNLAQKYPGAWWFNGYSYCTQLNRQGYDGGVVIWHYNIKCKKTKMRIKPLTS